MSVIDELEVGSPAPAFSLPASTGGHVALNDYKGKANVILFFVREYG
jgi:peroxiredoxin